MSTESPQTSDTAPADAVASAIARLVPILQQVGRADLVDRTTAAAARLRRPSTIVCVVGEFKQGKSSLVNGLLGQAVCPVDDDLARPVPGEVDRLLRRGEQGWEQQFDQMLTTLRFTRPASPSWRRRWSAPRSR